MSHQEISTRTDELTDTVQVVADAFPKTRAYHRPSAAEWFRWLIYNDETLSVLGVVTLDSAAENALNLLETKVLLRSRAMDVLCKAA